MGAIQQKVGFPGGSDCKESACNAGDADSISGSGSSSGEGNDYPPQYSWLENSMDRGAWGLHSTGHKESDTIEWLTLSICTEASLVAQWQKVCGQFRRHRSHPWVGKIPWRREWQPTPVFLPGESCGQRSLVGYSPWGHRVRYNWATSLSFFLSALSGM